MSPGTRAKPTGLDERKEDVAPTGSSQGNCQQGDEAHRRGKKTNSEQLHIIYRLPPSKVGLKLSIQKTKIMASVPITLWQIDGEVMETVRDFIFLGSKITADGDCSHEMKKRLLLGRKAMTNLDSILKSRDITLPSKVCLVKAMVFQVVMYGCESWTVKKAEHRRIDAFVLFLFYFILFNFTILYWFCHISK